MILFARWSLVIWSLSGGFRVGLWSIRSRSKVWWRQKEWWEELGGSAEAMIVSLTQDGVEAPGARSSDLQVPCRKRHCKRAVSAFKFIFRRFSLDLCFFPLWYYWPLVTIFYELVWAMFFGTSYALYSLSETPNMWLLFQTSVSLYSVMLNGMVSGFSYGGYTYTYQLIHLIIR